MKKKKEKIHFVSKNEDIYYSNEGMGALTKRAGTKVKKSTFGAR